MRNRLNDETRGLVTPFWDNTVFEQGLLDFRFVRDVDVHTIFSRHERGRSPYLLQEEANDLHNQSVDLQTINDETERNIRELAGLIGELPVNPRPVIVEDGTATHDLILEGNKRTTAVAYADSQCPTSMRALIGHSSLTWRDMLARFGLNPSA